MMSTDFSRELDDSLTTLKGRFNLGKAEQRGNPAQLVLLAEHAIKVNVKVFYVIFSIVVNDLGCKAGCCNRMHSALL